MSRVSNMVNGLQSTMDDLNMRMEKVDGAGAGEEEAAEYNVFEPGVMDA